MPIPQLLDIQQAAPRNRRIRLFLERLEDRLTPSWSSVPPATVPVPSLYTPVVLDTLGDAAGDSSIATTEVDWYRFTAPAGGTYVFQTTTPGSLDTVMGIYSSTGLRGAYNDDVSTSNTDSRITVSLTAGRTYSLGITNYLGTPGGSYSWSINGPSAPTPDDAYENNDTFTTASQLGTLTASRTISNLVMADTGDWFRFTLSTAGTSASNVRINFQHAQGDLDLELYSPSGSRIRFSDDAANSEQISFNGLAAGIYTVRVLGYQGARNPNYSMILTPPVGAPPPLPGGGSFSIQLRMTGLTTNQQAIFQQAAARWQQVIIGDLPDATYNGTFVDDVLIDASARTIDGRGGVLGQAGPDRLRSGSFLPYHGVMQFDSADLSALESSGGLIYTVMHEIGHILGLGTIWSNRGLLSGRGTSNPRFTGSQATAEYNRIFGRADTGVPVENSGGTGTRDSHWEESVFGSELMTGYLNSGSNPLSRITVASFADLGYQVNLSQADNYGPAGGNSPGGGPNGGLPSLMSALLEDDHDQALLADHLHLPAIAPLVDASARTASESRAVRVDWTIASPLSLITKKAGQRISEMALSGYTSPLDLFRRSVA